jgi:choline dehydrogenase
MQMGISQPGITYNDRMRGLGAVWQALRYLTTGRGFMSIPSGPVLAFVRSQPHLETPDLQIHFVPFTIADLKRRKLGREPGLTASIYQLLPESRGSIHIKSNDPTMHPAIRYNFLSDAIDRQVLIDGVKWTRRILNAPALDGMRGSEIAPGDEVQSDSEILDWIRGNAQTAYHPVATCKMGVDEMAVVDPRLKVHGLDGLRIADGSIMPTLMSGNTNAACIMIGEKAAEMILEDAA